MLISILIPCFNGEPWIGECIDSALAQSWPDTEVVVVDDGSTDGSLDIIRGFGERIRWESGENRGGNAARNRLLALARGGWLQYLDADDYLLPEKVRRQADFARLHPDCDVVISPVLSEKSANGRTVRIEVPTTPPDDPAILLALWRLPQTGGPLWRKSALERVNGWRVGQICCQEHELYLRLLMAGARFAFCDGAFAVYRELMHPARLTHRYRLEIVRQRQTIVGRLEQFLRTQAALTRPRRQAVNDARHELARWAWNQGDQSLAAELTGQIAASDPAFQPSPSAASPLAYRLAYRLAGFHTAQRIAAARRALTGGVAPHG